MICAIDFSNLHSILRSLYDEMMPLCGDMAGVAQGIAGLGALFYVAYRIWQSLARAEPIDVFPLLRPFVIGFCIMFFPTVVLGTIIKHGRRFRQKCGRLNGSPWLMPMTDRNRNL